MAPQTLGQSGREKACGPDQIDKFNYEKNE